MRECKEERVSGHDGHYARRGIWARTEAVDEREASYEEAERNEEQRVRQAAEDSSVVGIDCRTKHAQSIDGKDCDDQGIVSCGTKRKLLFRLKASNEDVPEKYRVL